MNSFTVWSESLVPLTVTQGDATSESVTIYLVPQEGGEVISHDADFETVDGEVVADLTFTAPEATEETIYDYYVTENFESESPLVYPDPQNCTGGQCELPTITVCPLEGETS